MDTTIPQKVFIVYSRQDLGFLSSLEKHLNLLVKNKKLSEIWSDGNIIPGEDWDLAIKEKLNGANIIILLISIDFFASDYIDKEELVLAFDRHKKLQATVIPVLIRPCHWKSHAQIQSLQVLPRNADPIVNWSNPDQAYTEIVQEIENVIKEISGRIESMFNKAIKYYENNNYEESYKILLQYLPTNTLLDTYPAFLLGKFFDTPLGSVQQDFSKAFLWYKYAAGLGSGKAHNNLGNMYFNGTGVEKDPQLGFMHYFESAKLGETAGMFNLGNCFRHGLGVAEDQKEALKYFEISAKQGDILSQYQAGLMYIKGVGANENLQIGLDYLRSAAEGGYGMAQSYLAAIYLDGILTGSNHSNAHYWATKAAAQNDSFGLYLMGVISLNGFGVPPSKIAAARYFRGAADLGHEHAKEALTQLVG